MGGQSTWPNLRAATTRQSRGQGPRLVRLPAVTQGSVTATRRDCSPSLLGSGPLSRKKLGAGVTRTKKGGHGHSTAVPVRQLARRSHPASRSSRPGPVPRWQPLVSWRTREDTASVSEHTPGTRGTNDAHRAPRLLPRRPTDRTAARPRTWPANQAMTPVTATARPGARPVLTGTLWSSFCPQSLSRPNIPGHLKACQGRFGHVQRNVSSPQRQSCDYLLRSQDLTYSERSTRF